MIDSDIVAKKLALIETCVQVPTVLDHGTRPPATGVMIFRLEWSPEAPPRDRGCWTLLPRSVHAVMGP